MSRELTLLTFDRLDRGLFINRPNRFIVVLDVEGEEVRCHLHDSGRLKELLIRGAEVIFRPVKRKGLAKTNCDVLAVKAREGVYAITDSRIPNMVFRLLAERGILGDYVEIHEEYTVGGSRFDFLVMREGRYEVIEVKGCNLVRKGVCYFPDAPSLRAVKHIKELIDLLNAGWRAGIVFIALREDAQRLSPNRPLHPEFANILYQASKQGVYIRAFRVSFKLEEGDKGKITYGGEIPVVLT